MLAGALGLHVLCMVGTFGLLLGGQLSLPPEQRDSSEAGKKVLGLANALTGIGLIAGVAAYVLVIQAAKAGGGGVASHYHMVIGFKFMLLFAVGACLGIAGALLKKGKVGALSALRWTAMVLLAVAAFLGVNAGL